MLKHLLTMFYGKDSDHDKYFFDPLIYNWYETKIYKEICKTLDLKLEKYKLSSLKRLIKKEIRNNNEFIVIKKKLKHDYIDEIIYNSKLSYYSNFITDIIDTDENNLIDWVIITDYAKNLNKGNKIKFKSRQKYYFYLLKKN